jgi:DNA-binding LytR/AlgR family response regulator
LLVNLTYVVRLEAVTKESARLIFDGRSLPIELSRLEAAWVRKALGPGSPADRE